jgi:hypothetical protein
VCNIWLCRKLRTRCISFVTACIMKFALLQNGKLSYSVLNVNICQQSLYTVNFQEVSLYLWNIFFSPQFSWIACWHIVNWKTVSWSSSCDMKVDQHLSLRVWHIHIKIMHRYARGSCCCPPPPLQKKERWLMVENNAAAHHLQCN